MTSPNAIDYGNIDKTIKYFTELGYTNIEVPWTVPVSILNITKPKHVEDGIIHVPSRGGLIASGEQGFLSLIDDGILLPGKYITTTPCFRDDEVDFTHSKQFMKVELIDIMSDLDDEVDFKFLYTHMVSEALQNFKKLSNKGFVVSNTIEETLDDLNIIASCDINIYVNNVPYEVGSYGIRKHELCTWIYGTAIAEPRFSRLSNTKD